MRLPIMCAIMSAFVLAVPIAAQEIALDTVRLEYRAPAILAEARELLGHERDAFVFAVLRARTPNQAARYCELEARYHQALEDDFTRYYHLLFFLATTGQTVAPDSLGKLGFDVARKYAEQRSLMSVSLVASTESEQMALGRACVEAKNAVR
jgi:hypothetical protein